MRNVVAGTAIGKLRSVAAAATNCEQGSVVSEGVHVETLREPACMVRVMVEQPSMTKASGE
jgi:hypothetical protein